MQFIPSPEQQAIFDYVLKHIDNEGRKALAIDAKAGTGKTTSILELIKLLTREGHDITGVYCAFNRDIVDDVTPRLSGTNIKPKTFHQLSMGALMKHLKKKYKIDDAQVEANKYRDLINAYVDQHDEILIEFEDAASFTEDTDPADVRKAFVNGAFQLCHYLRVRLEEWDDKEKLDWIIQDYALNDPLLTDKLLDIMIEMQKTIMFQGERLLKETGLMDFDDMIYWVCRWDLFLWQNKWVFVDEAQDLSPMQRTVVSKVLDHKKGFIVIVGDPHQAIYRFTGADSDSFSRTVNWFKADILPLSVTRRCDKIIAHHARQNVEGFTALDNAERGKFIWLDETKFSEHVKPGDMVICRVKAPLISKAIECIAQEIPAIILGGNIGTSLIELMETISKREGFRWSAPDKAVDSYQFVRVSYFMNKEDEAAADTVRDDCQAIKVLLENSKATSLKMFSDYVNDLFSDSDGNGKVILCTGHKAKGLEADRVFILQPEKMPLTYMGMHPESYAQEKNLQYVAWTRAKHELIYLTNDKFMEPYIANPPRPVPTYVQYDFESHRWTEDGLYMLDENGNTAIQLASGKLQEKARPEDTQFAEELIDANTIPAGTAVDFYADEETGITGIVIVEETETLETDDKASETPSIKEPFVTVGAADSESDSEDGSIAIPERDTPCYTVYFEAETDDGLDLQNPQNFSSDDEVAEYLQNLLKTLPYQYVVFEYLSGEDRDEGDATRNIRGNEWLMENDYSSELEVALPVIVEDDSKLNDDGNSPVDEKPDGFYSIYYNPLHGDCREVECLINLEMKDDVASTLNSVEFRIEHAATMSHFDVRKYSSAEERDNEDSFMYEEMPASLWLKENGYIDVYDVMFGIDALHLHYNVLGLDTVNPVKWAQIILANKDHFVVLDTETTTWANDPSCEVVQLAIVDLDGNALFNQRIKPHQTTVSLSAAKVHGITDEMLVNEKHIEDYLPYIRDAIQGKYIIAYNAAFDEPALANAFRHAKIEAVPVAGWQCAMIQYTKHNPNKLYKKGRSKDKGGAKWKLTEAVEQQRMLAREDAHDALANVIMTVDLIKSMAEDHEYRWKNKKGYKIGDIVKVKASGVHMEVLKPRANGDLNLRDVKDDSRLRMAASMIELVTRVEDLPVPADEVETGIIEDSEDSGEDTLEVITQQETDQQPIPVEAVEVVPITPGNPYQPIEDWFTTNVSSRDDALKILDLLTAVVEEIYPV